MAVFFGKKGDAQVASHLQEAERARAKGQHDRAVQLVREAGQVLTDLGRYDEAIDLFTNERDYGRAAEVAADKLSDWRRAAQLWFRAGDFAKAARARLETKEVMLAAELFERSADWKNAAAIYEREEDFVRASSLYEKAGEKQHAADLLVRALSSGTARRVVGAEAEEACRRAGVLYAEIGHLELAVRILRWGGQNAFAGRLLARAGRHDEAIDLLTRSGDYLGAAEIARSSGDEKRAQLLLGERAEKEGRFVEAAACFESAEQFVRAARLYEYAGEVAKAAEVYERSGQHDSAAELYEQIGRVPDAKRALRAAGRHADADALDDRAEHREEAIRAYAAAGDYLRAAAGLVARARKGERVRYLDAAQYLSRVAPEHPKYFAARSLLAEVFAEQGDAKTAINVLQALLAGVRPAREHLAAFYQYARLLELEGFLASARNAYRAIAAVDPNFRDVSDRLALMRETDAPPSRVAPVRAVSGAALAARRRQASEISAVPVAPMFVQTAPLSSGPAVPAGTPSGPQVPASTPVGLTSPFAQGASVHGSPASTPVGLTSPFAGAQGAAQGTPGSASSPFGGSAYGSTGAQPYAPIAPMVASAPPTSAQPPGGIRPPLPRRTSSVAAPPVPPQLVASAVADLTLDPRPPIPRAPSVPGRSVSRPAIPAETGPPAPVPRPPRTPSVVARSAPQPTPESRTGDLGVGAADWASAVEPKPSETRSHVRAAFAIGESGAANAAALGRSKSALTKPPLPKTPTGDLPRVPAEPKAPRAPEPAPRAPEAGAADAARGSPPAPITGVARSAAASAQTSEAPASSVPPEARAPEPASTSPLEARPSEAVLADEAPAPSEPLEARASEAVPAKEAPAASAPQEARASEAVLAPAASAPLEARVGESVLAPPASAPLLDARAIEAVPAKEVPAASAPLEARASEAVPAKEAPAASAPLEARASEAVLAPATSAPLEARASGAVLAPAASAAPLEARASEAVPAPAASAAPLEARASEAVRAQPSAPPQEARAIEAVPAAAPGASVSLEAPAPGDAPSAGASIEARALEAAEAPGAEADAAAAVSPHPTEGAAQVPAAHTPTPAELAARLEPAAPAASSNGAEPKQARSASDAEAFLREAGLVEDEENEAGLTTRVSSLQGVVLRSRFRIERRIGKGAQAHVYLARDLVLDRPVAIKVLNEQVAQDPAALDRFLREARLAARVHHASCIAIFDFGQERGITFMAMEYFKGRTLRDRLVQSPLTPVEALRIAREVAEALGAVHAAGIVHRDVKPTNVMVDDAGNARLTDFGVAKSMSDETASTGVMVGTMKYMSPEQARGKEADRRSDVFSLGVVLFEMLAGKPPFGGSLDALIRRVTQPPPVLPDEIPVPDLVRSVVQKCMQRKPDARYQSVTPLIEDLTRAIELTIQGEGTRPPRPAPPPAPANDDDDDLPVMFTADVPDPSLGSTEMADAVEEPPNS